MTMASYKQFLALLILMLTNVLTSLASITPSSIPTPISSFSQANFQLHLEHKSSQSGLTKMQLFSRKKKPVTPMATPSATPSSPPPPDFKTIIHEAQGDFTVKFTIGTPPRSSTAIIDTGSSLIWTQCLPCMSCYNQTTPIFKPFTSSSFTTLMCYHWWCNYKSRGCRNLCKYTRNYVDGSYTNGYLAHETFTLGNDIQSVTAPKITFGCGVNNSMGSGRNNPAGVLGLGRGPLSLVSQLKIKKFSYILPTIGENKKGTLSFGSLADLGYNNYSTTPIITNPVLPTQYYLSLEGISLDDTLLLIPKSVFAIKRNGSGGMVLHSKTATTFLIDEAYQVLKMEFVRRVSLPVVASPFKGLDLCFQMLNGTNSTNLRFPKLKFHFENMVVELPEENYMFEDSETRLVCLGINPSDGASIFGSLQQQNFVVIHDLEKQTVAFIPDKHD